MLFLTEGVILALSEDTGLVEQLREIPLSAFKESAENADLYSGVIHLHAYQPPRQLILEGQQIFNINCPEAGSGGINEKIWQESYKPIIDSIVGNDLISLDIYGTLRDWIKVHHPESWRIFKTKISAKNANLMLGDTYLHPILPLLPDSDKSLLINIGLEAFYADFGYYPQGLWLPESAVNDNTLTALAENGLQFILLKDNQISADHTSRFFSVKTAGGSLRVYPYNGKLSERLAHGDISNADNFAAVWKHSGSGIAAVDWETFGHHRGDDSLKFLNYLCNISLPLRKDQTRIDSASAAVVRRNSSWSCPHELGRWIGRCNCDGASFETNKLKQDLHFGLISANNQLNKKLNKICSNWPDNFKTWFLSQRLNLSAGGSVEPKGVGKKYKQYFNAKLLVYVGLTSCAWFFGKPESVERVIAEKCLQQVRNRILPTT